MIIAYPRIEYIEVHTVIAGKVTGSSEVEIYRNWCEVRRFCRFGIQLAGTESRALIDLPAHIVLQCFFRPGLGKLGSEIMDAGKLKLLSFFIRGCNGGV